MALLFTFDRVKVLVPMSVSVATCHLRQLSPDDYPDFMDLLSELNVDAPVMEGQAGLAHFGKLLNHDGTSVWACKSTTKSCPAQPCISCPI